MVVAAGTLESVSRGNQTSELYEARRDCQRAVQATVRDPEGIAKFLLVNVNLLYVIGT